MAAASTLTGAEKMFEPANELPRNKRAAAAPATGRCLTNVQLEAFNKGRGRAYIVGARRNSIQARALEAWLRERIDVVRFEYRPGSSEFHVNYDDGTALPGRFIRSLRDKVHTLNRIASEPFHATPVHSLKGRVRIQVTGIGERELATLTMLAGGLPGVKQTRLSRRSHHAGGIRPQEGK